MISPTTVFQGMPTWDTVMAQPLAQRMQSFRDLAIRKQLSVEAVDGWRPRLSHGAGATADEL